MFSRVGASAAPDVCLCAAEVWPRDSSAGDNPRDTAMMEGFDLLPTDHIVHPGYARYPQRTHWGAVGVVALGW